MKKIIDSLVLAIFFIYNVIFIRYYIELETYITRYPNVYLILFAAILTIVVNTLFLYFVISKDLFEDKGILLTFIILVVLVVAYAIYMFTFRTFEIDLYNTAAFSNFIAISVGSILSRKKIINNNKKTRV